MNLKMFTLIAITIFLDQSFAADCSAFIQKAVQPPVANIEVHLTKSVNVSNPNVEHFNAGADQVLKANKLKVFVDINNSDKSVRVLVGQKGGSVSSFEGSFSSDGTLKSTLSFNGNSELVISCND